MSINKISEYSFKERGSKFYGFLFPRELGKKKSEVLTHDLIPNGSGFFHSLGLGDRIWTVFFSNKNPERTKKP